ncbi:MAG: 4'-phosphopantetheinyl transferase family protein [Candidatus Methylumidiphilus sp.]
MVEPSRPGRLTPMALLDGEIHVHRLDLASCADDLASADWNLLDAAERERALRIRHEPTRRCFVHVRAALRSLLAQHLGCGPGTIAFDFGAKGKPRLAGAAPDEGLVFNVSHSGNCGLIALARDTALGVDVERCRAMASRDSMAERCFAAAELAWWRGLPDDARERAFFRLWSCKEAFVKATGIGIALGLADCAVDLSGPPRLAAVPAAWGPVEGWRLAEIDVGPGYAAAVCQLGAARRLCIIDGAKIVNS